MATNAVDSMEHGADSGTANLERKRPHNVISRDGASNTDTAYSTPRKRAKHAGKLGHQDHRDFVPGGASFSTSAVPVEEAQDNDETLSGSEVFEGPESDGAEQQKALIEGRRLIIGGVPPNTTEDHLNEFFKGYSVYVTIHLSQSSILMLTVARIYGFLIAMAISPKWTLLHRKRRFSWTANLPW